MTTKEYYSSIYSGNISKSKVLKEPYHKDLLHATNFLPPNSTPMERIYCLLNNLTSIPICEREGCGVYVKFPHHLSKNDRYYRRFCSTKCSNNDTNVQMEKSKTCMLNYGVDNPSKNDDIHQKKVNTVTKNHGGFLMQSPTLSKIIKETNILKYGYPVASKHNTIKNRIKNSHLKRSKIQNKISSDKRKQTMIIRYGIDHNPINFFSKIAIKYIENFIKVNKINPKLCLYGKSEFFIRNSNNIYFFDLVIFKTERGIKNKDIGDIDIVLEYDGKFWHPNIDQSITYRNTPMILQGMTYREKFLYDKKKELIATQILKKNDGRFMKYRENQIVRILP